MSSLTRVCSICKSPGVTKSTCPLNKNAKNKNSALHVNATRKINSYLKRKQVAKKQAVKKQVVTEYKFPKIIVLDNDECLGQFGLLSWLNN